MPAPRIAGSVRARPAARADDRADGGRGARAAVADPLPEPAVGAVLRRAARRSGSTPTRSSSPTRISGRRSLNSLLIASGMTLIAVPLGGVLAFVMERTDLPAQALDRAADPGARASCRRWCSPSATSSPRDRSASTRCWATELFGGVPWGIYSLTAIGGHRRAHARAQRLRLRVVGAARASARTSRRPRGSQAPRRCRSR